ncbi:hypothetical protein QLH62_11440 [Streptococcus iniae]|nr:hypothetical protein QLH62_11440 [Streptococcus iniae]
MKIEYMEQGIDELDSDFRKRVNRFMNSKESATVELSVASVKPFRVNAVIRYYENKPSAIVGKTISQVGKVSNKIAKIIDLKGFKRGKK